MQDKHLSVGRLAISWVVGLTLSWLLIVGPPPAAARAVLARRAHVLKGWNGYRERQEIGRAADEQWVARQRAAGPTARTQAGEPVYAVARVGSAAPRAALREKAERTTRVVHRTMLAWGLLIPVLLALRTRGWVRGRRRLAELERYTPDAPGQPRPDGRVTVSVRHAHRGDDS